MSTPDIWIGGSEGINNRDMEKARARLKKAKTYRDLSTVIVVPTRGMIPARAVERWMGLMTPMNQMAVRLFVAGAEVGEAYEAAFEAIEIQLPQFRYVLTLEEDNLPPPDGLLRLLESIEGYAAVGGIYWTKGEEYGQPMIYGDPNVVPMNFVPQLPQMESLQECNGLGMGFTLFDMKVIRDAEIARPWFKTEQSWSLTEGGRVYTQDLYFFEKLRRSGLKVACDTRVKVGHLDPATGIVY